MSETLALKPWLEGVPHLPVGVDLRLPWPDWLPGRPGVAPPTTEPTAEPAPTGSAEATSEPTSAPSAP